MEFIFDNLWWLVGLWFRDKLLRFAFLVLDLIVKMPSRRFRSRLIIGYWIALNKWLAKTAEDLANKIESGEITDVKQMELLQSLLKKTQNLAEKLEQRADSAAEYLQARAKKTPPKDD